ncbi:RNA polymerase sigma-70 factor, ECF subfamily [Fictibacillus solisalsi]|uniref:RNA polymerase sigma-70 factor, ECF subfamily n=2 Tax=Fictibacillus solisalsi TaxID=459525 RepID=A0A1H0BQK4_9BACL|nr:RNA polymerase sigma-70 factor, ECF subfamily [Fictibacillus solisalsi]
MGMNTIDDVITETRKIHMEFDSTIQPYKIDLWRYCKYITGSPWEGEDLFQETLLKAFTSLTQVWNAMDPKAYLFRIATNNWIDHLRKQKKELEYFAIEEDLSDESKLSDFEIREALESLLLNLTPKQATIFLLLDVFSFTGTEVASMTNMSESAIYTSLHRSRKKLKTPIKKEVKIREPESSSESILDKYLVYFNTSDVEGLLNLMTETVEYDVSPGFREFSKQEVRNGSLRFGLPGHLGKRIMLWGKEVNIVLAKKDDIYELHDINYQEVFEDKIVFHKSYFFCKELMSEAAKELGIPLQLEKPPVDWR